MIYLNSLHNDINTLSTLTGCQNNWKAKNWTFENLLNRYDLNNYWYTSFSKSENDPWEDQYLNKKAIWDLVNSDYNVKVFHRLDKHMKGWVNNETNWKLDLMDEYSFPYPMTKDLFEDVHVSTDQAYVMVATPGTGKISYIVLVYIILVSVWWKNHEISRPSIAYFWSRFLEIQAEMLF